MAPQAFDLEELKSKITQLPTLPTVVTKVLHLLNNPKTSAEDLSNYIGNDPALSSMVLKLANSAFYGIPQTVSNIQSAIVILGQNSLKTLVIPISLVNLFPNEKAKTGIYRWDQFWIHSVETAVYARALAQRLGQGLDREQLFTAGLLHDIGKLILKQLESEKFEELTKTVFDGGQWHLAEQRILGYSCTSLGDALFSSWNFPDSIREPLRCQYAPEDAGRSVREAWVLQLAKRLSMIRGHSLVVGEEPIGSEGEALSKLGLRTSESDLLESLMPELTKAEAFLNLFHSS